jgi:hypothetical protein
LYFSRGFFVYFSPLVHVYIRSFDPQINTSVIHNMVYKFKIRVSFSLLPYPSFLCYTCAKIFVPFAVDHFFSGILLHHGSCRCRTSSVRRFVAVFVDWDYATAVFVDLDCTATVIVDLDCAAAVAGLSFERTPPSTSSSSLGTPPLLRAGTPLRRAVAASGSSPVHSPLVSPGSVAASPGIHCIGKQVVAAAVSIGGVGCRSICFVLGLAHLAQLGLFLRSAAAHLARLGSARPFRLAQLACV